jgi:hypothetical protein
MRLWLDEKRTRYVNRLFQSKGGPPSTERGSCPKCNIGRPVWRCLDCSDTRAVCVLCCRNIHKFDYLHRVEKWNGRFYQRGALWQVGVKIYTGHNGTPCPRSIMALSDVTDRPPKSSIEPDIVSLVASCSLNQIGDMSRSEHAALKDFVEKRGQSVLDIVYDLNKIVLQRAEEEAEQMESNGRQATADAESSAKATVGKDNELPLDIPIVDAIGDIDDEWEDEDERPLKGHIPRFLPRPPPRDGSGNPFMTIVHTNGMHSLPIVWCSCPDNLNDRDLQLLDLRLYPASYDDIKTAFTFLALDDHRQTYLECKASHYQYHNKLRRLTCAEYPDASPNRYAELCRVARQWRNLKYKRWFWSLQEEEDPARGKMALFCAACPQPGINLEPGWKGEHDMNPWVRISVYQHIYPVDLGLYT